MKAGIVIVAGLVIAACNDNTVATDGGSDAPSDALTCGPAPVAADGGTAMHPPNPAHAGVCTNIDGVDMAADYVACNVGASTDKCAEFQSGQPGAACAACIESQAGAATWGVIVFNGSTGTPNIGGCVDDALGQVAEEPSSCGELVYASYSCQNAACNACQPNQLSFDASDFDTCDTVALTTICADENAAVQSPTGPCATLLSDAGLSGPVASCFPDSSIADPGQQETAWLTSFIRFMCGP